ncbi:MAG: phosphoglucosamine mutase [Planctomycetota bacterium]|nr:phosphoglucosamine mutase [Planctomycetota bacterium]
MSSLMIGISGVRGIVGESLTPQLLVSLGMAFGTYVEGNPVVVGMDTRNSGEMVKHSVFSGLLSCGCEVIDLGVCPTPTLSIGVKALGAAGGIMISASHNPIEWNALKFFGDDGVYLDADEGRQLLDIYYQGGFQKARWNQLKNVNDYDKAPEEHIRRVLGSVDAELIRSRKFKVAIDCCNGAGVEITQQFLARLGCELVTLNCEPDGYFPHNPEPSFVNLKDICRTTRVNDCELGFALDPDADRLAVIAHDGTYLGEEMTLALAADHVLSKNPGPVVMNLSTTKTVEAVVAKHGCESIRVPVGEVNVSRKMAEVGSPIGGEGNGGVIDPRVLYGRDSLIGMALTLEMMAERNKSVKEIVATYPRFEMIKDKVSAPRTRALRSIRQMMKEHSDENINTEDGLRIDYGDSWVHIRASNTEPIIRVVAEAESRQKAKELVEEMKLDVKRRLEEIEG